MKDFVGRSKIFGFDLQCGEKLLEGVGLESGDLFECVGMDVGGDVVERV